MVRLEVNDGWMMKDYDFTAGMTADDLIAKFKNEGGYRFKNIPLLWDTSQNQVMAGTDEIVDGRYYQLRVTFESQVDKTTGIPLGRTTWE